MFQSSSTDVLEMTSFLKGEAGTLPKRMTLVFGSVKFIVTHGLCCFMGLSTSQKIVSAGKLCSARSTKSLLTGWHCTVKKTLYITLSVCFGMCEL